ncbi:S8 family peptidase [Streptomyces solicathayae]|uniref:S8 family serine peptidase n=1 Tax=Streptomyces solicathayae TaxID=3081768 RepID=A0ABZ0M232_9ACTN|nr:S8 family serine peptidase [Streptomyces sp. HUAS YS2]WOX25840.1 S8 family serine peptidase [Streptomyces sp. HUAS YS2]
MRPISRTALGAATAAVLAVTALTPSVAASPGPGASGDRPLVGTQAAAPGTGRPVTVTLVTGDRVLVTTDRSGRAAATALPREDGTVPLLETRQTGRDLYVYPEGAAGPLAAGRVDEELFNVTGLIRQGYDDSRTTALPLIAVYDSSVDVARAVPASPRGAARGQVLKAAHGVALKADKKNAAAFWADITSARSRSGADVRKVWLDRKVEATLERSTKQVRAPEAWAAGYDGKGTKVAVLDTGADAEHPDLKGRITASHNFTDSSDATDRQGHGTHTISTVGGSGAASDGKKKGVAPGAELLNGKVLNDGGSGATSWIIAGMEWAVAQGADVVSMSLGNPAPTDCTDPMSAATEQLARSTDTLFVVAAGNTGPGLNSVSSPGCAPSVLTVGAVDRDDSTAPFSSRGPARVSHTLKPEIAAPGVAISAAAAGGRGVYAYRSMSGTSMATPHVAGAAAVVKQRHPNWTPRQIKAALVSSAKAAVPGDARETGGGRLDVKAAVDATVLGAPAVQGGSFAWPQAADDRTTVAVPYTNTGDRPVKLDLAVRRVTGNDGTEIDSPVARLGASSVTVPAGATVEVPLALNPAARLEPGQYGDVTGRVLATADGVSVSTPFSLYVEPRTVTLRVRTIDRLGRPASGASSLDVVSTDTATGERRTNAGATEQTYRLRAGSYFLSSYVVTPDAGENAKLADSITYLGRPQIELTKDTTVVLDARKAHKLSVRTDRPTEVRSGTLTFARSWDATWTHAGTLSGGRAVRGYYASVEGEARDGGFEFASYWRAAAPLISEFAVVGGESLHPVTATTTSANLDGTGETPIVDAKSGTAEELAAAGVRGKIALVRIADGQTAVTSQARDAKAAGAKAVLAYHSDPGRWLPAINTTNTDLPVLAVESAEGQALLDRLAAGPVTIRWKATAKSPYVYTLAFPHRGEIDEERTYRVDDDRLGRSRSTFRSMGVAADYVDFALAGRPDGRQVLVPFESVAVPGARTEFYTPGDTTWQRYLSSSFPWGEFMVAAPRTYQQGEQRDDRWYDGVISPRAPIDAAGKPMLAAERQGDLIGFAAAMWGDGTHHAEQGSFGDIGNLRLRHNGQQIGSSMYPYGVFDVPAQEGTYELEQFIEKFGAPAKVWQRSTSVDTVWRFRSARDENVYSQAVPLLFPRYGLPEDGAKTLAAEAGQKITLTATGHGGYTPAALVSATLSYSYDGGATWAEAPVAQQNGTWTATVDHAAAAGKQVTLRAELTDANGNSVRQTVTRAYDVR